MSDQPLIGVVMGSDSDWSVMSDAVQALKEFGIEAEVEVLSAHRTPERMIEWGKAAAGRGLKVIIAGAGGAALTPLYEAHKRFGLSAAVLHADETPVQQLDPLHMFPQFISG